jgi:hypothetical protein
MALALALTGLAPVLALADEPDGGVPLAPPPAAAGVPGQSVELALGEAAPFTGNLSDKTRWAFVLALRTAAEKERDLALLDSQAARAAQARAESDASAQAWRVGLGVGAGALAAGLITGLILGLAAKK